MLKKLLKYDLQALFKYFIPMTIFMIAYSILGSVFFKIEDIDKYDGVIMPLLIGISILGYVLILIAYCIVSQGLIVVDFFKTMVTDRGYLTHTLPVKKSSILISKYIAGFIIQIISYAVVITSLIAFLDVPRLLITNSSVIREVINETLAELFTHISAGAVIVTVIIFIICCLVSIFFNLATFFLAIAIGQRVNRHKIVGSIVAYGVLSIVIQIISGLCTFIIELAIGASDPNSISLVAFPIMLSGMTVLISILTVIMSFVIHGIFNKKLNLD